MNFDKSRLVLRKTDGFFICPNSNCRRKYQVKYSLIRHIRNECTIKRRYPCPICHKKFTYGFIVIRHLQHVHKLSPMEAYKQIH
ncbi:hypothetical protein DMENIID0001_125550 [Sergentomyia squamirostris]